MKEHEGSPCVILGGDPGHWLSHGHCPSALPPGPLPPPSGWHWSWSWCRGRRAWWSGWCSAGTAHVARPEAGPPGWRGWCTWTSAGWNSSQSRLACLSSHTHQSRAPRKWSVCRPEWGKGRDELVCKLPPSAHWGGGVALRTESGSTPLCAHKARELGETSAVRHPSSPPPRRRETGLEDGEGRVKSGP